MSNLNAMEKPLEKPIKVEPNSALPMLSTLIQRILIALFTYFGLAVSHDDTVKGASLLATVILAGWGAYRSYRQNEAKKRMEPYAPNRVASLKE